jgi:hypothetical protein
MIARELRDCTTSLSSLLLQWNDLGVTRRFNCGARTAQRGGGLGSSGSCSLRYPYRECLAKETVMSVSNAKLIRSINEVVICSGRVSKSFYRPWHATCAGRQPMIGSSSALCCDTCPLVAASALF